MSNRAHLHPVPRGHDGAVLLKQPPVSPQMQIAGRLGLWALNAAVDAHQDRVPRSMRFAMTKNGEDIRFELTLRIIEDDDAEDA